MGRTRASYRVCLVGHLDVQRARVGLGVHGHRAHRQRPAGADHAAGDLAAVGDEDLREHGGGSLFALGRALPEQFVASSCVSVHIVASAAELRLKTVSAWERSCSSNERQ